MTDTLTPTFEVVFKRFLKRVLRHWTPITVALAFMSTTLSMLTLYVFMSAIGRVDMFVPALDSKAALAAWLLVIVPVTLGYLFVLSITNWFYGTAVSMVARNGPDGRRVATLLFVPLLLGFAAFFTLAFIFEGKLGPDRSVIIIVLVTATAYGAVFYLGQFRQLIASGVSQHHKYERAFVIGAIGFFLVTAVMSAVFPTTLIINTYVGEDTADALWFVALFSFFTQVLSLAPTLIFFVSTGTTYRRLIFGCVATVVLFFAFLLGARGAMSSITYAAAGKLELRQSASARFVLDGDIGLTDLDNLLWHTRLARNDRVEIQGYQLFAFGEALLVCPSVLLAAKLHQLPKYTSLCILTSKDKIDRKPRKLGYQTSNNEPAWQAQADRLAGEVIQLSAAEP